jgi:hypothetical protein
MRLAVDWVDERMAWSALGPRAEGYLSLRNTGKVARRFAKLQQVWDVMSQGKSCYKGYRFEYSDSCEGAEGRPVVQDNQPRRLLRPQKEGKLW